MKKTMKLLLWVLEIVVGCALFSLGFDLFLAPHNINAGGLSGLAMIFVELAGRGSVGWVTLIANIDRRQKDRAQVLCGFPDRLSGLVRLDGGL